MGKKSHYAVSHLLPVVSTQSVLAAHTAFVRVPHLAELGENSKLAGSSDDGEVPSPSPVCLADGPFLGTHCRPLPETSALSDDSLKGHNRRRSALTSG